MTIVRFKNGRLWHHLDATFPQLTACGSSLRLRGYEIREVADRAGLRVCGRCTTLVDWRSQAPPRAYVRFSRAHAWHVLARPAFTVCGKYVTIGTQETGRLPAGKALCQACDALKDWAWRQKQPAAPATAPRGKDASP